MAGLVVVGMTALSAMNSAHALVITTTDDANTLVNTILGSGVTIVGTPVYNGGAGASGTFTDGATSGIGIGSGIILTTGNAGDAVGPNSSDELSTENGFGGDADLDGLLPAGSSETEDATTLTFDFSTDTGDLFFSFVFASEEYNEYVGDEYNDVFGFFLDGVNIALIPGTSTPVAINNVNCGDPYSAPDGGTNCNLYNNNDLDDGGPFFDIEYDGFTNVFTATALGLAPGTHTIKLAIADVGDSAYDSAVFIQAGTFSGGQPTEVPEPATIALIGVGLAGLGAMLRRRTAL